MRRASQFSGLAVSSRGLCRLGVLLAAGCQVFASEPQRVPPKGDPSTGPVPTSTELLDTRPVIARAAPPPPISGGTLLALSDNRHALVADPDRDRISLVDYEGSFFDVIQLEPGALPGRAAEDEGKHAYVILRGTGEVLTIDLDTASAGERRRVCVEPRGIALAPSGDRLTVACAEGKLVDLPLAGLDGVSETAAPLDVRDVAYSGDALFVSRFRSAELLQFSASRSMDSRARLPSVTEVLRDDVAGGLQGRFDAAVAWRMVPGPEAGSVVIVHQRAVVDAIDLAPDGSTDGSATPSNDGSAYGASAGTGCGGIVHSAVTVVTSERTVTSPQLAGAVLPVDVAVSRDGIIAVASAGIRDPKAPTLSFPPNGGSVALYSVRDIDRTSSGNCITASASVPATSDGSFGGANGTFSGAAAFVDIPAVAVAFSPVGKLLVQTREPASLVVFDNLLSPTSRAIALAGASDSVLDTGHEIFHRDSGAGIACASCHVEGTDDGRVWNFVGFGPRRTQPLDVGLEGTAPFHWDGTLSNFGDLMTDVFVGRMGGPKQSPARVDAVQNWLFTLQPRLPVRDGGDPAAQRGKALFESANVGCSSCHSGPKLSNNTSVDVGTGGKFQVPSLLGVGQRAPLMHDGCAATLSARFDPVCGGSAHGNTSQLSSAEVDDLVAYLESL